MTQSVTRGWPEDWLQEIRCGTCGLAPKLVSAIVDDMRSRYLVILLFAGGAGILPATEPSNRPAAVVVANLVDDRRLAELEAAKGDRPVDAILEQALAYDERGQTARAIEFYQDAAARGDGAAELRLGWFEESGNGGEQSYAAAKGHYEKAAALGAPEANMRLGLLALEGWGMAKDAKAAVAYLLIAAESGYQPAQRVLSEMYFTGTAVGKDLSQALGWAEKAAAKKDPEAELMVGAIRQRASRLPQDIQTAREWYQLSAEQEYTAGMRAMAATFLKPNASPADVTMGIRWLELADESGDSIATFYLAGMYLWHPLLQATDHSQEKAHALFERSFHAGELAAAEVLELGNEGHTLAEAFRYVLSVPAEDRYVKRLATREPSAAELAEHILRPQLIKVVTPVYPAAMALTHTDGSVTVEFTIDTTGRVREVEVMSRTHQAFVEPAIAAVSTWKFAPGSKEGRLIKVRVGIKVEFRWSGLQSIDVTKFPHNPKRS